MIGAILLSAAWKPGVVFDVYGTSLALENLARDVLLIMIAMASLIFTPDEHREANGFTWEPIREVAILFADIFICIVPVLAMLDAGANGSFAWLLRAVTAADGSPHQSAYFWLTGVLSAFLDNAPTYLVFFELAGGDAEWLMTELAPILAAISMGAVYMGALTYIGNAPNFMVYAIATERGVKMPSFFGYMLWSVAVLGPVLALLTFFSAWRVFSLGRAFRLCCLRLDAFRFGPARRLRRQYRDPLDLEQRARPRQLRRCATVVLAGGAATLRKLVAHLAEDADMRHVDQIVVDLDEVGEARRRPRPAPCRDFRTRRRTASGNRPACRAACCPCRGRAGRQYRWSGPVRCRPRSCSPAAWRGWRD